ncbi:MAG: right-handed parallel beta-helix repeat-containing protein [Myxococcota bacterium]
MLLLTAAACSACNAVSYRCETPDDCSGGYQCVRVSPDDQFGTCVEEGTVPPDAAVIIDENGPPDAASPRDAALPPDATVRSDASVAPDAAVPSDAGVTPRPDAALPTDAAPHPDATPPRPDAALPDATAPPDAGPSPDAGTLPDAARPDATRPDAGAPPDAGGTAISGTVFEDVGYTGGAGTAQDAQDPGIPDVTVELYDDTNALRGSTVTDSAGRYALLVEGAGTYSVRVVSASANRGLSGVIPEQTYEHDGVTGNGAAGALGGEDPQNPDDSTPAGLGRGDTFVEVVVGGGTVSGVDFGFSYNLIMNTADSGQGSLRQFILNANALPGPNAALFQVPNNAFLGLSPDPAFLNGDHAAFYPLSPLPTLSDDDTTLDGQTQTLTVGDTSGGLEVQIQGGSASVGPLLHVTGARVAVLSLLLRQVSPQGNGAVLLEGDRGTLSGVSVTETVNGSGVHVRGSRNRLEDCVVVFNGHHGVLVGAGTGHSAVESTLESNGLDGVSVLGGATVMLRRNVITGNYARGIDVDNNGITPNNPTDEWTDYPVLLRYLVEDRTITVNGTAPDGALLEFFSATGDGSTNHGEAAAYLGQLQHTTGLFTFTRSFALQEEIPTLVTATATLGEQTSEFAENEAAMDWWNPAYAFRAPVTITSTVGLPNRYVITVDLDHAALVTAGKSLASGDDVRVVRWDGNSWQELDRDRSRLQAWNTADVRLEFRLQGSHPDPFESALEYWVYYGNPTATSPPAAWDNLYLAGDHFSDTNLSSTLVTDDNNANVEVVNGELVQTGDGSTSAAFTVALADPLPTSGFHFRHKARVQTLSGAASPEAKLMGVVSEDQAPQTANQSTENPRRRLVAYHRHDGRAFIFYVNTSNAAIYWSGSAWGASASFATLPLGQDHVWELYSTGTSWQVVVTDANGAELTRTTPVPWSSVKAPASGDDLYLYFGEVYTDYYSATMTSGWVYLRPYVEPEPTTVLGAEEAR